jgi:SnoaL-like domain
MQELTHDASSTTDVELLTRPKAILAAYNRRDWDAYFAELDPEFEWTPIEEKVKCRGREAVLAYHRRWLDAWEEFEVELEQLEIAPAGDRGLAIRPLSGQEPGRRGSDRGTLLPGGELRNGKPWRAKESCDVTSAPGGNRTRGLRLERPATGARSAQTRAS